MAQKVHTTFVDDVTGEEIRDGNGGEVAFGFDGTTYLIDLSDTSRAELERALAPYLNAARVSRVRRARGKKATRGAGKSDAAEIRAWAAQQGIKVCERGQVSAEVRTAYKAAGN